MSKYTTELRFIIESGFDIGLKDYPIFLESYRAVLNAKIIEHYYFREIGSETASLFKRFLNRTMNEIMPLYNQLYKSELLSYNPLISRKLIENLTRNVNSNNKLLSVASSVSSSDSFQLDENSQNSSSSNNSNVKNVFSDTPQGLISIGDVEDNIYASSVTFNNGNDASSSSLTVENNSNGTASSNVDNNMENNVENKENETLMRDIEELTGDPSALLISFRSTFLNIDTLIIDELNSCFMGLW